MTAGLRDLTGEGGRTHSRTTEGASAMDADQASSCDITSHRLLFLPAWGLVCVPMSPLQ